MQYEREDEGNDRFLRNATYLDLWMPALHLECVRSTSICICTRVHFFIPNIFSKWEEHWNDETVLLQKSLVFFWVFVMPGATNNKKRDIDNIILKLVWEPPLVLGHTDMWTNNLLFKRNDERGIELLAFVDWQCATVGKYWSLLSYARSVTISVDVFFRLSEDHQNIITFIFLEFLKIYF